MNPYAVKKQKSWLLDRTKYIFKPLAVSGFLLALAATSLVISHRTALAAACTTPSTDYGTDTLTVNAPSSGTYVLWARIMVPDSTNNSIDVQVDSTTCFNVGGSSSIPANTWTWVNYQNGVTGTPNTVSLSAGSHTIKLIGTAAGVSVDRVELVADTACMPVGTGDTCAVPDTTPPTVSLTTPTLGSTVSGSTVTVSANASDDVGVAGVQFKLDGSNLGSEDASSPYSTTWDSTLTANGTHTLTAVARDAAGNTKTSSSVTVTVSNTTSCSQSSTAWSNHSFTAQTSSFTFDFDATPNAANLDNVTGLSNGAASAYTSMAAIIRFNDTGSIDAINGSSYTSATNVPYTVNTSYHFKLTVNPTAHTYSVVVTPNGGSAVNLATNYSFRTDQATLSTFSNWALFQDPDSGGSLRVCNATINATSGSPKIGDINLDGNVDIFDLSIMLSKYNTSTANCDLNSDSTVNIFDLSILLSHYGS